MNAAENAALRKDYNYRVNRIWNNFYRVNIITNTKTELILVGFVATTEKIQKKFFSGSSVYKN